MGIQGLFQLLKPIIVETNLREFEGQTCAIDMMCWLYKGVYSCSYEIAKNFESFNYLSFPLKMIKILQSFNIKPICVFDGLHLNAKCATENGRREEKIRNKHKGELLDIQGNHEEAKKFFGKSMVISSKMINLFIEILHKLDIEVIIAPYEADAQISYLCKEGIADFGVSEDSDIVVFGCPTLVCKLQPSGDCSVIRINEIWEKSFKTKCKDKGLLELAQFNHEVFVFVCIMSGCDYLPSIERMGLKTSIKNFVKYKNFKSIMSNLSSHHTFKGKIPKNYVETVLKVRDLFLYQTVYDPITYKCRPLNDIPEGTVVDQNFLGKYIDEDKLPKYVRGWLDKYTFEPREVLDPDVQRIKNAMRDNDITTGTFYYLKTKFDFSKKKVTDDYEEEKHESNKQEIPLLERLCTAYTTEGGLENLVKKFNKKKNKPIKQSKASESGENEDDILKMCVNDETSPPVESVLRTRKIDANDVDLEKVIPFQNYFVNSDLIKNKAKTEDIEMENEKVKQEPKPKSKVKRSDLDKDKSDLVSSKIQKKKLVICDEDSKEKCKEQIMKHFKKDIKSVLN